ncbi:hypothetical protein LTR37_007601 [Vermiconidia calcicola]|uniref:Uncharacterized protein n=1 Tax=Vermiconidia calcicola TaxID=1690605 RepID=A0ACC3NDX4_9PEZI|nr:hypothetical protein LTR37_007601 [Vermiconidia calcicola]
MQNVELQEYPKHTNVSTGGVDELSDSDVQQLPGKNYDPAPDQRDMRRLETSSEADMFSAVFASSPSPVT